MDIEMLLEEVLDSLDQLINAKEIQLKYNIVGKEIFVYGDYNRLKQVFINILKNSIEALEEKNGGTIQVDYKVIDQQFKVIIKDDGIGMDEETLNRIFEMFYTTKKQGTGIGINLSKEIIEGHNGKIIYSSNKGTGTIVTLYIPIVNL